MTETKDTVNNQQSPDTAQEIENVRKEEIRNAPIAPGELKQRLDEHNAASPADSGGDVDAEWEDVNDSGAENVAGHNPTPGQSDAEANAKAIGVVFADREPLDFESQVNEDPMKRAELDPDQEPANKNV